MLLGAFATVTGTYLSGNIYAGILCGMCAGILFALVHGIISIVFKANQIVSGVAINIFAFGLTKFLCSVIFNSSSNSPRITGFESIQMQTIGNPFLFLCLLAIIISWAVLFKTKFGLRLRACGENAEAADSSGIKVDVYRFAGTILCGMFCGLGGAWLALEQHSFTDGMTAGRGYIALAAMIVGKWKPFNAAIACLLFAFAESLTIQFQSSFIPTQFVQMLPYVLTIIVLAGLIGKSIPPASSGIPFEKKR